MIVKKLLASVGLSLLVTASVFASFPTAKALAADSSMMYGDLNDDGSCDSADYSTFRQFLLSKISTFPNPNYKIVGDLNLDSTIDSADYSILRKYLLKVIDKLPLGTPSPTPTGVQGNTPTATPTATPTKAINSPTPTTPPAVSNPSVNVAYNVVKEVVDGISLNKYIVNVTNTSTGDVSITNLILDWKLTEPYNPSFPYCKKTIRPKEWSFSPSVTNDGKVYSVGFALKNNSIGNIKPGETVQFNVCSIIKDSVALSYNVYYMNSAKVFGGPLTGKPTKDTSVKYVEPLFDEFGNTTEDAHQIIVGSTITGNIDYSSDKDCFKLKYPSPVFPNEPIVDLPLTILVTSNKDIKCSLPLTEKDSSTKRYDILYSSNSNDNEQYITVESPSGDTGSYTLTFIRTDNLGVGTGYGAH